MDTLHVAKTNQLNCIVLHWAKFNVPLDTIKLQEMKNVYSGQYKKLQCYGSEDNKTGHILAAAIWQLGR